MPIKVQDLFTFIHVKHSEPVHTDNSFWIAIFKHFIFDAKHSAALLIIHYFYIFIQIKYFWNEVYIY